jgi:hypothetical protein
MQWSASCSSIAHRIVSSTIRLRLPRVVISRRSQHYTVRAGVLPAPHAVEDVLSKFPPRLASPEGPLALLPHRLMPPSAPIAILYGDAVRCGSRPCTHRRFVLDVTSTCMPRVSGRACRCEYHCLPTHAGSRTLPTMLCQHFVAEP